ncbi:hypothetical protein OG613_48995 (plasmid) [Streptomyces sp. NBC_00015]|uniref:hypothetical protein n=1 Tax=Streptomyces sp. NBC_00015 TaxID=2903611 RepID=UPI002F915734
MTTNQRSSFAAELARLARKHKGSGRAQAVTKNGCTVLFTGMWGENVGAIVITDPDGHEVQRADGWKLSKTAEVAAFLWDVLEKEKARAAERERLAGLKSVNLTTMDATGPASNRKTSRYHLTPGQLAQLLALAEQMAAENTAAPASEDVANTPPAAPVTAREAAEAADALFHAVLATARETASGAPDDDLMLQLPDMSPRDALTVLRQVYLPPTLSGPLADALAVLAPHTYAPQTD